MSRLKGRLLLTGAAVVLAAAGLAACGGGKKVAYTAAQPAPATPQVRFDNFGTSFAAAFAASANSEPVDAAAGVPALNLTAEPVDVS